MLDLGFGLPVDLSRSPLAPADSGLNLECDVRDFVILKNGKRGNILVVVRNDAPVQIYDIRLQDVTRTFGVIANDGLSIQTEISIRFRPMEMELGKLHR